MSNTLSLIVRPRSSASRDDVLREVTSSTGGQLTPAAANDVDEYSLTATGSPPIWIDLAAGYDDQGDPDPIPLGRFPWHFSIDKPSDPHWLDIALQTLHRIFDNLTATGRYDAILAEIEHEHILASNVKDFKPNGAGPKQGRSA